MKKSGFMLLALTLLSPSLFAAGASAYKISVVRDGQAHLQVAYNFWSGEYPTPVIDVNSKIKGTTKIEGLESLRDSSASKVSCTIKNGLYHPWSTKKTSVREYYTLAGVLDFTVVGDLSDVEELKDIKIGSQIKNVVYGSEGMLLGQVTLEDGSSKEVILYSDMLENRSLLAVDLKTKSLDEQWLRLECDEGHRVFVRDIDLLGQKGIQKGRIKGYGEISSAR